MSEERFNRIEEMLGTLIQMVGNTNARVEDLTERVDRLEAKVDKVANDLTDFREEVNGRFDRVEQKLRIMEVDADFMHRKLSEQERELNRHNALLKNQ